MTMGEHSSKYSIIVNSLLAVNTKLVYMFAFEIQTEDIYIQICLSGWLGVCVWNEQRIALEKALGFHY